jgi:hypothetical protein
MARLSVSRESYWPCGVPAVRENPFIAPSCKVELFLLSKTAEGLSKSRGNATNLQMDV